MGGGKLTRRLCGRPVVKGGFRGFSGLQRCTALSVGPRRRGEAVPNRVDFLLRGGPSIFWVEL